MDNKRLLKSMCIADTASASCQVNMGPLGPLLLFPHNFPHALKFECVETAWTKQEYCQLTQHNPINFPPAWPHRTPHYPNPVWSPTQHFHTIPRNQSPTKSASTDNLQASDARWNFTKNGPNPLRIFQRWIFYVTLSGSKKRMVETLPVWELRTGFSSHI